MIKNLTPKLRTCDGCTKCCEGSLAFKSVLNGEDTPVEVGNNIPCTFCVVGTGCSVYEKRPIDPCQGFSCAWKADYSIPEEFAPKDIGVMIVAQEIEGHPYTLATKAGKELTTSFLSWFFMYYLSRGENFSWEIDKKRHWFGSQGFADAMANKFG